MNFKTVDIPDDMIEFFRTFGGIIKRSIGTGEYFLFPDNVNVGLANNVVPLDVNGSYMIGPCESMGQLKEQAKGAYKVANFLKRFP